MRLVLALVARAEHFRCRLGRLRLSLAWAALCLCRAARAARLAVMLLCQVAQAQKRVARCH